MNKAVLSLEVSLALTPLYSVANDDMQAQLEKLQQQLLEQQKAIDSESESQSVSRHCAS